MNGPCVRASRATRSPSGSSTGSVNTSGVPGGTGTPSASRSRATSSTAVQRASPPIRTSTTRRASASMASQAAASDALEAPGRDLGRGQRAEQPQQVGHALGVAGLPVGREPLQLELELGQHVGVEQLPQLGPAQQLGQQALVEREGRGATLGDGRVAFVHERRDVAEEQRPRERRGLRGRRPRRPGSCARARSRISRSRAGHVVHVLEALADGLQHDREGRVLARRPRAAGRCADAAATAASAGRGRGAAAAGHGPRTRGSGTRTAPSRRPRVVTMSSISSGSNTHDVAAGRVLVGLGDPQHDAVVAGQRLGVDAVALAQPDADRQRPRCVHLRAVGRVDHDAPVAELVAEPLDQHRPVGRHRAGRLALLVEERDQVAGGPGRPGPASVQRFLGLVAGQGRQLAGERPMAAPSSAGRPSWSPFQNGSRPGWPGAGDTRTRSWVMSSIRHDVAPSAKTSPTRDS